jgi:hypothetical protein
VVRNKDGDLIAENRYRFPNTPSIDSTKRDYEVIAAFGGPAGHAFLAAMGYARGDLSAEEAASLAIMGATSSGLENIGAGIPTRVLGSAPSRLTNAQARDLTGWLGWKEVKPPSGISKQTKGELVFTDGKRFYSQDIGSGNDRGSHNGGTWKVFDRSGNRIGMADEFGEIFKK